MRKKEVNWIPAIVLITYQSLLAITLPIYLYFYTPSLCLILISVALLYITGLSITAGYHRLYSHRAYKAHPIVETVVLFFASMAGQGSALRWSFDHRLHHAFVDSDDDPYSIKKGFWYAHFLWILEKPRPIDAKVVPDLMRNKLVMFQEKHSGKAMILTNFIAFITVGWLVNDYLGAFLIALWTRLFTLHHFTWFINSLAHTWGDKPFSQEQSAVNNYVISLLTFGEGYHNYHHTFSNDYRNGIRWYHFDPTKWLIWGLNKLGLAYDLKRMSPVTINNKLVLEHKNLLVERLRAYWQHRREDLEKQVNELSENLLQKIAQFNKLKELKREIKKQGAYVGEMKFKLRQEIKMLKKSLKDDLRQWSALSHSILYHSPMAV